MTLNRRKFVRNLSAGIGFLGLNSLAGPAIFSPEPVTRIKPEGLKKGDKIMMIAPASSPGQKRIDEAVSSIQKLGYEVVESPNLRKENGFLAGTDSERLSDFHLAWKDKSVKGTWCVRGGYGASRILPDIDFDLIRDNPKVLIGYSDITALHNAIYAKTGLISFHGPVGTSDYNDYTKKYLKLITADSPNETLLSSSSANEEKAKSDNLYRYQVQKKGKAIGQLAGGNLTLIASMCGTDYLPSFAGKIVYLEDVGEKPYRIDRMLTQVLQTTDLEHAAAIVHGIYSGCRQKNSEKQTLHEVFGQTLGHLDIPQVYGLSFGHIDEQFTIPIGVHARLDTSDGSLTLLEKAVK